METYNREMDEHYMREALQQAQHAIEKDEIPVGCVIVIENKIIARSYNQVQLLNDSTAHAEMLALTSAFNYIGGKYLTNASIYITLEPCMMCSGALFWSKIGRVVYGAKDTKHGFDSTNLQALHPKTIVTKGVLEEACSHLLKDFFAKKRNLI